MFPTWYYNYGASYILTDPPIKFARPDGAPIPAPTWAGDLTQISGIYLAWSPDGRYLAFNGFPIDEHGNVEGPYEASRSLLLVAEPTSGKLFTANPEGFNFYPLAGGPTWSPDGSQIAIPLATPSTAWNLAIHIVRPQAGTPRQITSPGALFPSWSPVHNLLAYLEYLPKHPSCSPFLPGDFIGCDQATLKLLDLDSGAESTLLEGVHIGAEAGKENWYNAPAWSPDGQWLAVFHGGDEADLVVVDPDTGHRSVLLRSVDRGSYISVAPNAQYIAYGSRESGNDEVLLLPIVPGPFHNLPEPDAPPRNLTNDPSSDIYPLWSPDSRFLSFLSDRKDPGTGFYRLYTADLVTGEVRLMSEDLVDGTPAWVPPSVSQ